MTADFSETADTIGAVNKTTRTIRGISSAIKRNQFHAYAGWSLPILRYASGRSNVDLENKEYP